MGEEGHHDDVIPVHFGEDTSDPAKEDALHTFSHRQCNACEDDGMSVMILFLNAKT